MYYLCVEDVYIYIYNNLLPYIIILYYIIIILYYIILYYIVQRRVRTGHREAYRAAGVLHGR